MAEKKKNSQKKTTDGKGRWANLNKTSKILYTVAVIVILVPLLFLGYIYISAKENSGKPTVGSRFDDSLNPAITEQQLEDVKKAVVFDGTDKVEVNLISATLRITIDAADDASSDTINQLMEQAYEKTVAILPVETYFSNNKESDKMYDLEVHVFNYIPDEAKPAEQQIYMVKTKTSGATEPNVSVPTTPKNEEVANELLEGQKEAQADAQKGQ